jgi:hypothetical protein
VKVGKVKHARAAMKASERKTTKATKVERAAPVKAGPVITYKLRELDPLRKCGPATSVRLLYRVDETKDGVVRPHLVYFDRHGWYCEHGRTCSAVSYAQKVGNGAQKTR